MKRKTRRNHVPNLDRHSGSWIVTRIKDGKVIGEFFTRRNVERFDPKKTLVETAYQYLGRVNADIKSRRKNPRRTRRNGRKQKIYTAAQAKPGWIVETVYTMFGETTPTGNVYRISSRGHKDHLGGIVVYKAWSQGKNILAPNAKVRRLTVPKNSTERETFGGF